MAEPAGLRKLYRLGLSANALSLPISKEGLFKAFMDTLLDCSSCFPNQFIDDIRAGFDVIPRNETWCCLRVGEVPNQAQSLSHRGRIALDRGHLSDGFLGHYEAESGMLACLGSSPPRLSQWSFLVAPSAACPGAISTALGRADPRRAHTPPKDGADAAASATAARL